MYSIGMITVGNDNSNELFSLYDTDIGDGGSPLIENCDVENEEGMDRSGNLSSSSLNTDGGSPLIENCDVENEEGMERSGNLSSFSLNTDDLEYQTSEY